MTFEKLWEALCTRNPLLAKDTSSVTITAEHFRKALKQAYDQGAEHRKGVEDAFRGKVDPFAQFSGMFNK